MPTKGAKVAGVCDGSWRMADENGRLVAAIGYPAIGERLTANG
jgi:hypothetical protein